MNAHFSSEGLGNVVTATLAAGQVQLMFTPDRQKQRIEGQRSEVRGSEGQR